jgi:hypothetical protein
MAIRVTANKKKIYIYIYIYKNLKKKLLKRKKEGMGCREPTITHNGIFA